jgi:hypothetical protein
MRSVAALALLAGSMFAQGTDIFESAPPQVDQALRSRVKEFYQFHVEGKFRQADALVHEESKDAFFVAEKLKLKSFEIKHIKYEENFTQARVTTVVPVDLDLPGFGTMKDVPRPLVSFWKLDGGQWWWRSIPYDPCKGIESGSITLHKKKCVDGKVVEEESSSPSDVMSKGISVKELHSMVRASGNSLSIPSHLPAREGISITNHFPGPVTLQVVHEQMPGLEVRLDSNKVESGGSTTLVIDHKPTSPTLKPEMLIRVLVQPTGQVIPIKLEFQVPPADLASGVKTPEKQ